MAEISLKEYLEKVERLFQTGKYDEVVQHGRHILKHYPMNTPATRWLGRALVYTSEPQQAGTFLRRVLAVYPDDAVAHASLSEVNERLNKANEAIWHMERALEQAPGVKTYVEKLRSLYQQHRNIDDPRFQLTTGAVARQYIRNGLYPQAIETLQATLEKSPKRMDLQLHLAQTLWEAGMQVEAAETALDILDMLPYCLGANHLLTQLWLNESRPSDAQRYLNQIQEVEPYVALQLAQNGAPDGDAFILPELDYRRVAESQLATSQPDWLSQVSEDDMVAADEPTELEGALPAEDDALTELGEEGNVLPPQARGPGNTGLLMALDAAEEGDSAEALGDDEIPDWLADAAPIADATGDQADELNWLESGNDESLDDLFATFDEVDTADNANTNEAEALDWMTETELGDSSELPDMFASADAESDPMAWLQDNPADAAEQLTTADFFAEIDETEPQIEAGVAEDPLAWMQEAGVELSEEPEQSVNFGAELAEDDIEFADPDAADPLAWMQEAGVEFSQETSVPDFFADTPETHENEDSVADDPLAWMQDADVELAAEAGASEISTDSDDSLDWMQAKATEVVADDVEDSLEWLQSSDLLDAGEESSIAKTLPAVAAEADSLDWLNDDSMLDEFFDIESLSSNDPASIADVQQEPANDEEGWQDTMADENFPPASDSNDSDEDLNSFEWLNDSSEPDAVIPDWLTEDADEPPASEVSEENSPDWLNETEDDEFSWLDETDAEPAASAAPVTELGDAEPVAEAAEDAIDWLAGDEEEDVAEPASDMPDWLADAAPVTEIGDAEPVAEAAEDAIDWLSSDDDEDTPEPASDMPDWLADAAPVTEIGDAEPVAEAAEDAIDWLADDEEEDVAEPAADMPDWLADAAPVTEISDAEPVAEAAEDAIDWLAGDDDDTPEPASDMPDWLADAAPVTEISDAEPVAEAAEDAIDWLADDDENAAEPAADTPDWLADAAPVTEISDAEPVAEAAEDAIDWLAGDDTDDEQPAEPAADMPDWLADAAPVTELGEAEPVTEAAEDASDWLANDEEEDIAEPAADMPDWLADAAPVTEIGDAEPVAEAAEDAIDWLADDEEEDVAEPPADMPDWLSEAAPVTEISDAEPVADWLAGDDDEDAAEPPADMPDWLADAAPVTEIGDAEPVAEAAEDVVDWLSGDETDDEQPAATDAPDWLAELDPVDKASEAEPVAEAATDDGTFDWLADDEEEDQPTAVSEATEPEAVEAGERFEWPEENAQAIANELPEWLAEVETIADESEAEAEPVQEVADLLDEENLVEIDDPVEAEPVAEIPDWLNDSEPATMDETDDQSELVSKTLDWQDEAAPVEAGEAAPVTDFPDWVSDDEFSSSEELDVIDEPAAMDGTTRILSENFDWEDQGEADYETDAASSEFGWVAESAAEDELAITEDPESEQTLAGAAAPPPADNAPDWLNAMVPGLDLDYDAQEDDAPVESAYLEAPAVHRDQVDNAEASQDINWLVDIVDEETTPFEPIVDDAPPPTRRRFVFSRKPAWLRKLTEKLPQANNQDDDFDLPEWLQ